MEGALPHFPEGVADQLARRFVGAAAEHEGVRLQLALQLDAGNTGLPPKLALINQLLAPGAKSAGPAKPP